MLHYFLGGGRPRDLCRSIFKFLAVCCCIFSQKWVVFRNFRDASTKTTPKITFYCIFINKFPKYFKKRAQNFFAAPSAPQNPPFFQFVAPGRWNPTLEGWPPPKVTLVNGIQGRVSTIIQWENIGTRLHLSI